MSKAIKFKNNVYLDSSGITHNKIPLNNVINNIGDYISYTLDAFNVPAVPATTNVTTEKVMKTHTISRAGIYMIWASVPLNFYGQSGRELYVRLYINDVEKTYIMGVCNSYVYTLTIPLFTIAVLPANSQIKLTIRDTAGKTYSCNAFNCYYFRIQ